MPWDEFNSGIAELDGADEWFSGGEIVLLVGLSSASEINPSPCPSKKKHGALRALTPHEASADRRQPRHPVRHLMFALIGHYMALQLLRLSMDAIDLRIAGAELCRN